MTSTRRTTACFVCSLTWVAPASFQSYPVASHTSRKQTVGLFATTLIHQQSPMLSPSLATPVLEPLSINYDGLSGAAVGRGDSRLLRTLHVPQRPSISRKLLTSKIPTFSPPSVVIALQSRSDALPTWLPACFAICCAAPPPQHRLVHRLP